MTLHAMQFSQSLYHLLSLRSRLSLENRFQMHLLCVLLTMDNFIIHVRQKAWSCECLDEIICDTEYEDKMYTNQIEIKKYSI
jgi:hypothetical protein